MTTTGTGLSVRDIHKCFGASKVLQGIDLDIQPGEMVCFLGPSGCGKTTLLRIIAGLETQDSGTLIQGDIDISALPVRERDFGIVFQSYALFPNMTVTQNIAYGLHSQHLGKKQIAERVDELLELIGLREHAQKYPAQISGGQQQRVALARALAPSPGLLLLDEPLSALDARVRGHLRNEIRQLQQRLGVTTIMVTHDQEEALTMADRVVVMNAGRVEQVGTPREIYAKPATAFVASFIGSMNFIPRQVTESASVSLGCYDIPLNGLASQRLQQVSVAVRPETIEVVRAAEGELVARVEHIEYMGAYLRCRVSVKEFETPLLVDVAPQQALLVGLAADQDVGLRMRPESIHCFAA